VGSGIEALLTAGEFQAGITGGSLGLLLQSSGGVILQAHTLNAHSLEHRPC